MNDALERALEEPLAALAVDYWKLLRAYARAVAALPPDRARRAEAQHRFAAARLEQVLQDAGLTLGEFEGRALDASLPASVLNPDEAGDLCVVAETVEPAVLAGGRVLRSARVIVRAGEA